MSDTQANLMMLSPGRALPIDAIPVCSFEAFSQVFDRELDAGGRILALFVRSVGPTDRELWTLLFCDGGREQSPTVSFRTTHTGVAIGARVGVMRAAIGSTYPSLTVRHPAAHYFERDLHERHGVVPEGHPWLKPVRRWPQDGTAPFYQVAGDEVHEVAVGPVHAGVIEPGHFRFQCHGERVFHLEIALGYQHRGVLTELIGGPGPRTLAQAETIAGDTTVGHTWAYAQIVEGLSGATVSLRADALRAVGLELERAANHIGDLGAMAGDVGFLPAASALGALRGDTLNVTAMLCGSRFGRGLLRVGGVGHDVDESLIAEMRAALRTIKDAATRSNMLLWASPSAMNRFEETGTVHTNDARALGLVGVAARASGLNTDVRASMPSTAYETNPVNPWIKTRGDVYARGRVRWRDTLAALDFIEATLARLPSGPLCAEPGPLAPNTVIFGLTEGWRGEICHVALTDAAGRFSGYEVVDPSFHNWCALEMALRGGEISDFPLCNKSFNLSYAGHDL